MLIRFYHSSQDAGSYQYSSHLGLMIQKNTEAASVRPWQGSSLQHLSPTEV